jgi:hypothetical protein
VVRSRWSFPWRCTRPAMWKHSRKTGLVNHRWTS